VLEQVLVDRLVQEQVLVVQLVLEQVLVDPLVLGQVLVDRLVQEQVQVVVVSSLVCLVCDVPCQEVDDGDFLLYHAVHAFYHHDVVHHVLVSDV
jgi:hypothetical protein